MFSVCASGSESGFHDLGGTVVCLREKVTLKRSPAFVCSSDRATVILALLREVRLRPRFGDRRPGRVRRRPGSMGVAKCSVPTAAPDEAGPEEVESGPPDTDRNDPPVRFAAR